MVYTLSPVSGSATGALRALMERLQNGDTLRLEHARYDFRPEGAFQADYAISNNTAGRKPIAFPIIGKKNIIIEGNGAHLVFHGRIMPFCVDCSENVRIENLSIDYHSPFYAQADIIEADDRHTILQFDQREFFCRVQNGHFCFYSPEDGWEDEVEKCLVMEFARDRAEPSAFLPPYFPYTGPKKDHGFLRSMFHDVNLQDLGNGRIGMYGALGFAHTVGNCWLCTHGTREFPGIFLTDSRSVCVRGVQLYHTASMGVVGQFCEDILLDNVIAQPRPGSGRMLCVNADATHFVDCRGEIRLQGCKFISMMDDAMNVHGIYMLVLRREGENTLVLGYGHHEQTGVLPYRVGDTIEILDTESMQTRLRAQICAMRRLSAQEIALTLDRPVPQPGVRDVVENMSAKPAVTALDCECGANRPRGFLLSSSGRTLIERCRFHNMNCGIQIGGELKDWFESGATRDITVRNCDFTNSAYAGGSAIQIQPHLYKADMDHPFHGRIAIENNLFCQQDRRILHAELVSQLIFRGNTFRADPSLPAHGRTGENGLVIKHCAQVECEPLRCI